MFSEFVGCTHAIAVGNATQGLEIASRAAITVRSGDDDPEIIVPSISWISTASAAALAGAVVKFADVLLALSLKRYLDKSDLTESELIKLEKDVELQVTKAPVEEFTA
jgi:hypothetical protein